MATVYLAPSPTGDDSRTYAQAQNPTTPWVSVGKANASATSGDTLILLAGTHTWGGVTFTKNFTIQGATNDSSLYILRGDALWDCNSRAILVSNIKFTSIAGYGATVFALGTGTILTFNNCIFYKVKGEGIANVTGGIIGKDGASGVTVTMTSCLFDDCTDKSASDRAMFGGRNWGVGNVWTMLNCTFNFLTVTNRFQNIFFSSGSTTLTVKNCIFSNVTGTTMTWSAWTASVSTHNDFYSITAYPAGTGTITSDPLFVDAVNSNFNLRPSSPCVGTGTFL